MKITFNIEKLDKILSDFYNLTKITITLFDSELNCISTAGIEQPYCKMIRCDPERLKLCNCSNRDYAHMSRDTKNTVLYTCHAGILESVTPIFFDDTLIAYIMLGKLRDSGEIHSSADLVRRAAEEYGLDKEELLRAYNKLPVHTKSYIDSAIAILEVCISHIWSENIIRLHRSSISSQIEEYVEEHLSGGVDVDGLCRKFYVSRQTMYSIFKNEFNDTVANFVTKRRLQKAQRLLGETDLPVSEIAAQVGFVDYNYFIRFFKKKTGLSPLQYRKNTKQ